MDTFFELITDPDDNCLVDIVERPAPPLKKINSRDDFELCYLRHQYLRRAKSNPGQAEMDLYSPIAAHMARNTFFTYQGLFHLVGLDMEDMVSISKVQIVSFLGTMEITQDPVKYERFVCAHQKKYTKDPGPADIIQKNKANLTFFIKQRMQDVVRVCQQKARNIKGMSVDEFYAYTGAKQLPPWVIPLLTKNNEKYGYRKIDVATFKSARKKAKPKNETWFKYNNMWFISVPVDHRALELEDLAGADQDPRDNYHNMDPERIMIERDNFIQMENKKNNFQILPDQEKKIVFEAFIRENKRNKKLASEVETARKILVQMGL
jgi:hypothetical protein